MPPVYATASGAAVRLRVTAVDISRGTGPSCTDNIAELIQAAVAADIDWGYGDFELRIEAFPRSDAAAAGLMQMDELEDAATFVGQTPNSAINGLAEELAILGYEDHPLMSAIEKEHGSFLAALLPHADAPIVESFHHHAYDGNDCCARFATSKFVYELCYQTS